MDYETFRRLNLTKGVPGASPVQLTTIPGTEYQGYVDHTDEAILANIEATQQAAVAAQQAAAPPPPETRGGFLDAITEPFEYISSGQYGDDMGAAVGAVIDKPFSPSSWFGLPLTAAQGIEKPLITPLNMAKEAVGDLIYMAATQDPYMSGIIGAFGVTIPALLPVSAAFMSMGLLLNDKTKQGIIDAHGGEYGNRTSGAGVWEYMQSHLDDLPAPVRYPLRIGIELVFDPLTWTGIGAARHAASVGKLGRIGRTADEYAALSRSGKVGAQLRDIPKSPLQGMDAAARSLGVVSDTMFIRAPVGAVRAGIRNSPLSPMLDRSAKSIEGEKLRREGDDLVTFASSLEGPPPETPGAYSDRSSLAQNETPMTVGKTGDAVPRQSRQVGPWKGSPLIDETAVYDPRSGRDVTVPVGLAVPGARTFKIVHPNKATRERYAVTENLSGVEWRVDAMYNGDVIVSSSEGGKDREFDSVDDAFNFLYGRISRGGGGAAPPPTGPTAPGPATPPQPVVPTQPVVDPVGGIDTPGPVTQYPPTGGIVEQPGATQAGPAGPVVDPIPTTGVVNVQPTEVTPTVEAQPTVETTPVTDQPVVDPIPTTGDQQAVEYPSEPDDFGGGGQSGPQVDPLGTPDAVLDAQGREIKPKKPSTKKTGGPPADPIIPEMEGVHPQFQVYPHLNRAIERVYVESRKAIDAGQPDPHVAFWRDYADAVTPYGRVVDEAEKAAKLRKWHADTEPKAMARAMGSFQVERLADKHGTPLPASPYTVTEGSDIIWRKSQGPSNLLLKNRFTTQDYKAIRRDAPLIYEEALMTTNEDRAKALINVLQSTPGTKPHMIDPDEANILLTKGFGKDWRDIQDIDDNTLKYLSETLDEGEEVMAPRLLSALRAAIREERRYYTKRTPFVKETPVPFHKRGMQPGLPADDWMKGPDYMRPRASAMGEGFAPFLRQDGGFGGGRGDDIYDGPMPDADDWRLYDAEHGITPEDRLLDPMNWMGRKEDGAAIEGIRDALDAIGVLGDDDINSVFSGKNVEATLRPYLAVLEDAYKAGDVERFRETADDFMMVANGLSGGRVYIAEEIKDHIQGAVDALHAQGAEQGWSIRPGRDSRISSGREFKFPFTRGQEMAPFNQNDPEGLKNRGASETGNDSQRSFFLPRVEETPIEETLDVIGGYDPNARVVTIPKWDKFFNSPNALLRDENSMDDNILIARRIATIYDEAAKKAPSVDVQRHLRDNGFIYRRYAAGGSTLDELRKEFGINERRGNRGVTAAFNAAAKRVGPDVQLARRIGERAPVAPVADEVSAEPYQPRWYGDQPDGANIDFIDTLDVSLGPSPDGYYYQNDGGDVWFNPDFEDMGLVDFSNPDIVEAMWRRAGGELEEILEPLRDLSKKFKRARSEKSQTRLSEQIREHEKKFWDKITWDDLGAHNEIQGTPREIEEELRRLGNNPPSPYADPDAVVEPVVNDGSVDRVEELFASEELPVAQEPVLDPEAVAAADATDTELAPEPDEFDEISEVLADVKPEDVAPPKRVYEGQKLRRLRLLEGDADDGRDIAGLVKSYRESGSIPAGLRREFDSVANNFELVLKDSPRTTDRVNSRITSLNKLIDRMEKTDFDEVAATEASILDLKYRQFRESTTPDAPVVDDAPEVVAPKTEDEAVQVIADIVEAQEEAVQAEAPKKRGRPRKQPTVDPIDDPKQELPAPTPEVAKTIPAAKKVVDTEIKDETMAAVVQGAAKKPVARKKTPPPFKAAAAPPSSTPPPAGTPPPAAAPEPLAWEGERRPWNIVDRLFEAQIIDEDARTLLNTNITVKDLPGAKKGRTLTVGDYYLVQRQLLGDKNKAINVTLRTMREHYQETGVIGKDWAPKKLRRLLDAYAGATSNIRERVLMNIYTGPMIVGLNVVGNSIQTALAGNYQAAIDQMRPSYIRAGYRAVRDDKLAWLNDTGPGKYFDDMGADVGRDISINLGREGSPNDSEFAFSRAIKTWAGENDRKARNVKRVLNTAGVRGSEFIFHLHGGVELVGRMVNAEKHAREVAYAPHLGEFVSQVRAQYTKTGKAEALVGDLLKSGKNFSPDDVRSYAIKHGYTGDESVRLAQDWHTHADAVKLEGKEYADKVLFSYQYTNADDLMRNIFMFHYWYMRASARYTRAIIRNPYLMVNYQRAIEALEREAEGEPNAVRGMIRAFAGPGGHIIWIDPVKAVATAATFKRQAVEDGDEKQFDSFMSQSGLFLNPMLQAALAVVGLSENRGVDPTGSGPVRRVLGVPVNLAVSQFGGTYRGVPFQDAVGETVERLSGIIRDPNTYQSTDSSNRVMIRNHILDAVMDKHGIEQGTPLASWEWEAVNELELELSNFDSGVPSEITNKAYQDWSRSKFLQVGVALTMPVGTSLRSDTRDDRLNINRGEAYDETPTESELQITQSAEDAMPLTLRNEQFNSLFPSGELGRVDISPTTGETQAEVLAKPEMAGLKSFKEWQAQARKFGPEEFRAYMMQVSPNYRAYIEQIPDEYKEDVDRYNNQAIGYQAFLAANGRRISQYDRQPLAANDPSAEDPARQLFAWMAQNGYTNERRPYNPFPLG